MGYAEFRHLNVLYLIMYITQNSKPKCPKLYKLRILQKADISLAAYFYIRDALLILRPRQLNATSQPPFRHVAEIATGGG